MTLGLSVLTHIKVLPLKRQNSVLPNWQTFTAFCHGQELRFPEDCFPAVAYYRNGVIVSCTLHAAFMISELLQLKSLTGVDVLSGFS